MKTRLLQLLVYGTVTLSAIGTAAQPAVDWNDSLSRLVRDCAVLHIPAEALENKIREGRAKKRSGKEIVAAVATRKKLLLRIRDGNNGVMPGEYTRQLFELEREVLSGVPAAITVAGSNSEHKNPQSVTAVSPKTGNRPQRSGISSPDQVPEGRDSISRHTSSSGNRENRFLHAGERAEKSAVKAAQKAQRRMEKMQQRLQKKTMNRHGSGR